MGVGAGEEVSRGGCPARFWSAVLRATALVFWSAVVFDTALVLWNAVVKATALLTAALVMNRHVHPTIHDALLAHLSIAFWYVLECGG